MRIYICGQRSFGAAVFRMASRDGHDIAGVSAPVSGSAGGLDPLRAQAQCDGVPVLPPGVISRDTMPAGVDLIVAAHSHDFIGRLTRSAARLGAIGFHPSLLPRHRGRDAVRWTIAMRDPVAGGTVYWLTDNVDAGPVAAQEFVHVPPGSTASDLWRDHLFGLGVGLLSKVLADLSRGLVVMLDQDERCATWEPSWDRPPIRRHDILMLGDGSPHPFRVAIRSARADAD